MRFLADVGISPSTVEFLKQLGHEAEHVRTLGMQRASDLDIVAHVQADRSVVTFDLDFGEILALGVLDRLSVIILRLHDERAAFVNDRLVSVSLNTCRPVRTSRALVTGGTQARGTRDITRPNPTIRASVRYRLPGPYAARPRGGHRPVLAGRLPRNRDAD